MPRNLSAQAVAAFRERLIAFTLSGAIAGLGPYKLISEGRDLPVFAFALASERNYTVFEVSERLRIRGWLVPAYTFPANRQDLSVLRIVVRSGLTRDMADLLLEDLGDQTKFLESLDRPMPGQGRSAFSHN